jgi:hypothetical protein
LSFVAFKEVSINNPGTATVYGADDILEVMKIFNSKVVSNRQIRITNPWVWENSFDILAAPSTPTNPPANTKRLYVEPSNNHLIMKSTGGIIVDFDVLGAGAVGEANTTSNSGIGGVAVVLPKSALDLPFKSIAAGSTKIAVTDDTVNKTVDVDVVEANLSHNNIGGILNVTHGGTGLNTITTNALLKGAGTGNASLITAGTDGNILTMVSGVPTWAAAGASADTKAVLFEAGTQVGAVARRFNLNTAADFDVTENAGSDRFDISLRRGEYIVGSWNTTSGLTKTNLGTTFVDLQPASGSEGNGCDVDGTGRVGYRLYVSWNKNFGSGTHSVQVISQTTTDVLATLTVVDGRNVTTGTLSAYYQDQIRSVKLQAKSTVSTDDPIFYGARLYFK